jgi:hypothetical protein
MRWLTVVVGLALGACTPENGPLMRPGEDCLRCHGGEVVPGTGADAGFQERSAKPWTLAGTVYETPNADPNAGVLGAHVDVTDANGWSFQLRTNLAGNFYSAEQVAFPLHVCVELNGSAPRCMQSPAQYGSCNACHTSPGVDGANGRITP